MPGYHKHEGPCYTTFPIACSRLSVSGGLKKRAGNECGLVGKKEALLFSPGSRSSLILLVTRSLFQSSSLTESLRSRLSPARFFDCPHWPRVWDPACPPLTFSIVLTDWEPGTGYMSKNLRVCQKYSAAHHILNSLLGVLKCDQTWSGVFDIILDYSIKTKTKEETEK